MALELEDGTGKSNAESYASVDDLKAKALAIGATIPTGTKDLEVLLRKAVAVMRRGDAYIGTRYSRDQALDFPRNGVVIESFSYDYDELPPQLIEAQCLFAIAAHETNLEPILQPSPQGSVIERTVDVITTKWAEPGVVRESPRVQSAERVLKPLLDAAGGLRISRA